MTLESLNNNSTATDSYKYSHYLQTQSPLNYAFNYIESRGGRWDHSLFFGLQMHLPRLSIPLTKHDVDATEEDVNLHMPGMPFNRAGFMYIVEKLGGYLPLEIRAVPEGTLLPNHNVMMTITNTDENCGWLPSFVDSANLLRAVWYPTTVATNSFFTKIRILNALLVSSDDPFGEIKFKLHDFSARGSSSQESAVLAGAAHLVNFMGTDTFECLRPIREIYGERMAGQSIPASEHTTASSWGRDNEVAGYRHMLSMFAKPGSMVACVSDTYDLWNAVQNLWGDTLKQEVIDSGAVVIIRPDSGDPTVVPLRAVQMLGEKFGYTVNSKGFKVLPKYIRVIQGDGVEEMVIQTILDKFLAAGWSIDNIAFGMGGALSQKINRDTLKFAAKNSAVCDETGWRDTYKDPMTDPGKTSKRGRLALIKENGQFKTVPLVGNEDKNLLDVVWRNGETIRRHNFNEIRARADIVAIGMSGS